MAFDPLEDSKTILERAIKIEKAVLDQFDGKQEKDYRDKLRSLILNLKDKKNPELRASVVSGELSVTRFCTMSKEVNITMYARCLSIVKDVRSVGRWENARLIILIL